MKRTLFIITAFYSFTMAANAKTQSDMSLSNESVSCHTFNPISDDTSGLCQSFLEIDDQTNPSGELLAILFNAKGNDDLDLDAKTGPGELKNPEDYGTGHLEAFLWGHVEKHDKKKKYQPRKKAVDLANEITEHHANIDLATQFMNENFSHIDDYNNLSEEEIQKIKEHPLSDLISKLFNIASHL